MASNCLLQVTLSTNLAIEAFIGLHFRRIPLSSERPIVVVGSINMDLVSFTEKIPNIGQTVTGSAFHIHPGGKGANQAVAVARLGYPVQLIGGVGSDIFGTQLKENLERFGVDTTAVKTSDGPSGVASIVVSNAGENSIVVTPGANAHIKPQDVESNTSLIRGAGIVLAQLEIPIDTVEYLAWLCAREKVPLILDPAPAKELPPAIFSNIAWFTPNESEADFYLKGIHPGRPGLPPSELADQLLARGLRGVVLKRGAAGSYLRTDEGLAELIPAWSVNAVDTTAAGDAFNGGFATALMLGKSPTQSAEFASAVAGISVTRNGAQNAMPAMNEVTEFIAARAKEMKR
jgi:ribokinase